MVELINEPIKAGEVEKNSVEEKVHGFGYAEPVNDETKQSDLKASGSVAFLNAETLLREFRATGSDETRKQLLAQLKIVNAFVRGVHLDEAGRPEAKA